MKVLVSPEFSSKLSAANVDGLTDVGAIYSHLKSAQVLTPGDAQAGISIEVLGEGILTLSKGAATVFVSTGEKDAQPYVLLLDVTVAGQPAHVATSFLSTRDPRTNALLNPNLNSTINPRFNSTLNPRFNSTINPRFNSTINPRFNSTINPRFNSTINPRFNSTINPRFNSTINPRFNSTINPSRNQFYDGPYVYDSALKQTGFVVRANGQVSLIFGPDGDFTSYFVSAGDDHANVFSESADWVEYLHKAADDVWLRFDLDGEMIGLIV